MAEPPDVVHDHEPVQQAALAQQTEPVRALEQEPGQEHYSAVVAAPGARDAEPRPPDGEPWLPGPCYELAGDHPKPCYRPEQHQPRHQQMLDLLP